MTSPTSPPPPPAAPDPSPAVRLTQQIREGLTDAAGLAIGAYLCVRHELTGREWLALAVVLLVPQALLVRLARVAAARAAGRGAAAVLVTSAAVWGQAKAAIVGGAAAAAVLGSCAGSWGTPLVAPIPPHAIERAEYGMCIEAGGKVELPRVGTVAVLSATCFRALDDSAVVADASSDGIP